MDDSGQNMSREGWTLLDKAAGMSGRDSPRRVRMPAVDHARHDQRARARTPLPPERMHPQGTDALSKFLGVTPSEKQRHPRPARHEPRIGVDAADSRYAT